VILGGLAIGALLLDLVPLELQRRIVNGAIEKRTADLLIGLCLLYAAVALIQGGTKFALNLYQSAVSERANRRLRLRASAAVRAAHEPAPLGGQEGVGISIIVSEVEAVGGFVGTALSDLVLHGGVLVTVFGYLMVIQPWMALTALLVFGPQILFVPVLQRAINRRTAARIKILRVLSVDIVKEATDPDNRDAPVRDEHAFLRDVRRVYDLNLQIFRRKFSMNFLMNLLHHVAVAGILLVGGLFVIRGRTEVGTVVAFISALSRITDPWGDLVNYFRDMTNAAVKYRLIASALGDEPAPR
jgi:ABC-type multidrug transport system fused ATPase/permease subunit